MSSRLQLSSTIKKSRKLKIFQTLEVIEINFKIESNRLIEMRIESDIILQDHTICQNLLKIFTLNILTNSGFINQLITRVGRKKIENSEFFSCLLYKSYVFTKRKYHESYVHVMMINQVSAELSRSMKVKYMIIVTCLFYQVLFVNRAYISLLPYIQSFFFSSAFKFFEYNSNRIYFFDVLIKQILDY